MVNGLSKGDKAYIVDNARFLREVTILRATRDLCVIKYTDTGAIIRIRKSRLFSTDKEAIATMPQSVRPKIHASDYYLNH